jgi:hypothetical protein
MESEIPAMPNRNEQIEREQQPPASTSAQAGPLRRASFSAARIALVIALILLVIAGVTIVASLSLKNNGAAANLPTASAGTTTAGSLAANANGTVSFIDQPGGTGHSDALKLAVNGLLAPPSGSWYAAWLVNTASSQSVALGTLIPQGQTYALDYAGNNTNLLGQGNEIEITLEHSSANTPSGTVLLTGAFPAHAFVYIRRLLASYAGVPGNTGLLVGLYNQAQALNTVAQQLPGFASQRNIPAIQCLAQSMLDIIEGKTGAHYRPLPVGCASLHITSPADGYGLLGNNGYISAADAQLSLAASQSDATSNIQVHRRHVGYALDDMRGWLATLDQDTLALLDNPGASSGIPAIVTFADHDLHGVDLNHDGSIDYVPGEAGATIAYVHGQYMANLVLSSPSS